MANPLQIIIKAALDEQASEQQLQTQLNKIRNLKVNISANLLEDSLRQLNTGQTQMMSIIQQQMQQAQKAVLTQAKATNREIESDYRASQQSQTSTARQASQQRIREMKAEAEQAKAVNKAIQNRQRIVQTAQSNLSALGGISSNEIITGSKSENVQRVVQQVQSLEQRYQSLLKSLNNTDISTKEYDELLEKLKGLQSEFQKVMSSAQRTTSFLSGDELAKFNASVSTAHARLEEFGKQNSALFKNKGLTEQFEYLKNFDISDPEQLKVWNKEYQSFVANTRAAGAATKTFRQNLTSNISKFSEWFFIGGVVSSATQQIRNMISAVTDLDASLTELRKVSDLTGSSLDSFVDEAFDLGSEIGRTGQEVIDATTTFKRAGYDMEESLDLSEAALVMTNVGDNITDTAEAASYLISVLKGFNMDDSEAMSIVDAINETSNKAPIDFDNIAEGLRRVSSTLSQTGSSLGETIGLLTGGFAQLRDIEMVSSGLVMISQRLRGIDEDGEAIDGLVPKLQEAFQEYANISIEDENGELRSTYGILQDLAQVWPTLTSQQRQYLGELAAGNRQVKVLNSIMAGWQDVEAAVENANNSVGSAEQENAAFMDSIQGRLNNLTSTFQQFANESLSSDTVKWFIDLANGALQAVDAIGGLQTILTLVAGIAVTKFGPSVLGTLMNIKDTAYVVWDDFRKAWNSGQGFFSSVGAGISNLGGAWNVAGTAITLAITGIVSGINAWNQAQEEARKAAIEAGQDAAEENQNITQLTVKYMSLSDAVKEDQASKEELLETQNQLIQNLDIEKGKVDSLSESFANLSAQQLKINQADILAGLDAQEQGLLDNQIQDFVLDPGEASKIFDVLRDNNLMFEDPFAIANNVLDFTEMTNAEGVISNYERLKDIVAVLSDNMTAAEMSQSRFFKEATDTLSALEPLVENYSSSIEQANASLADEKIMELLQGAELPDTKVEFEDFKNNVVQAIEESNRFIGSQENIGDAVNEVLSSMPEFSQYMGEAGETLEGTADSAETAAEAVETLADTLEDTTSRIGGLQEALDNYKEFGQFSSDDLQSIIQLDPNLEDDVRRYLAGLSSADALVEAIKQSMKEAESLYRDEMIEGLWPDLAKQEQIAQSMSSLYRLDASNYTTMEEAKAAVKLQTENQKWLYSSAMASDYVNLYLADFKNYAEFEQAKSQIEAGVLSQIQGLNATQIGNIAAMYGVDLGNFTDVENQKPEVAALIADKLIRTYGVVSDAQKESLRSQLQSLEAQKAKLESIPLENIMSGTARLNTVQQIQDIEAEIQSIQSLLNGTGSYDPNSFLKRLNDVVKEINIEIPQTSEALQDIKDKAEEAGKAAEEAAKKAADAAQKAVDELEDLNEELQENLNNINDDRDAIESLLDTVMAMLKQRYEDEIDRLDELISKEEEQRDSEIEALEKETEAYTEKIDAQLELLRLKEEERQFEEELADKSKDLSDLKAQLLALELDDSDYGKRKRLELEEEIAEKTEELEDFQHDHSVDLEEDALEQEKENAEEALDAKKEALEEEYQAVIGNYEKQKEALEAYLDDEWNLRQEAYRLINKGGQELYQSLLEYNKHYGNAIDADVKQQWDKAYDALGRYNNGQINVKKTLEQISSTASTLQSRIDQLAPKIENARKKADSLKTAMNNASSSIKKASDQAASLYNNLNKASSVSISTKKATQYVIVDTMTGEIIQEGYKSLSDAQRALRQSGAYSTRYNIAKLAKGRTGGPSEMAIVDEEGMELITRGKGRMTYLESGDGVVPHNITQTLMDLGSRPEQYIASAIASISHSLSGMGSTPPSESVHVEYGDIIIQGNADRSTVAQFRNALKQQREYIATLVYGETKRSAMRQGYKLQPGNG